MVIFFLFYHKSVLFKDMGLSLTFSTIYNKHLIKSCKLLEQKGFIT